MFSIARLSALVFTINTIANMGVVVSAEEPAKATVTIESFKFAPNQIKVKKGSRVAFVNKDAAPHTVSPANQDDFTGTGRLLQGERKIIVFDHAGKIKYFCDFHPSMEGVVIVTE